MSTGDASSDRPGRLEDDLARWVAAGAITPTQADAIRTYEAARELASAAADATSATRALPPLSLTAEAVAYVGMLLVGVAGVFMISRFWNSLAIAGQVGVGALVAVCSVVASRAVSRMPGASARRLDGCARCVATAGVALIVAVSSAALGADTTQTVMLPTAAVVLALSVALWRNHGWPLQAATAVAAAVALIMSIGVIAGIHAPATTAGFIILALSIMAGAAALHGTLRPDTAWIVMATVGGAIAAQAVGSEHQVFGAALGIAVAFAAVTIGLSGKHSPVTAVGVLVFIFNLTRLLGRYMRSTGAGAIILIAGVIAVVYAVRSSGRREQRAPKDDR